MKSSLLLAAFGAMIALGAPAAMATMNVPMSHGRYCGVGNSQEGAAPVDALDAACMAHDECAGSAAVPACSCHATFRRTVRAIIREPDQTDVMRQLGQNMITAISLVPCTQNGAIVNPATLPAGSPPPGGE